MDESSLTWNVSRVVRHEATPLGVQDVGGARCLMWTLQDHRCLERSLQSLTLLKVLL